ncbi:helix-turn-helix transcriptional regulator [Bacillus sp. FJAT-28004]|uniref:helix-turn-helix transcriptional regulator n=1 Tax=Bacillus sp. FJAT-28004 TaxID=1679165 RepID=UPI0006B4F840|nr:helix-turn-helix transcriptional regulator [Bacillus sp. FJAT-28004]
MSENISYTTEEISKLLKISKLTVYDLIKKGDLASYRVGKQMRVDASDLEAYKQRSKGSQQIVRESLSVQPDVVSAARNNLGARSIVITGQDISLDILGRHIEKYTPTLRPLRSNVGSLDSLISMYNGHSDVVSTHLIDGDTGEYNIPYIRKLLVGSSYVVINLLSRQAGLFVQKGNPRNLKGWDDLSQPDLRVINREKGSGARVLLDEQLRLHGISAQELLGYEDELTNHLGVAAKVAGGEADVGVGIEKAAAIVDGVDFVPLISERYDLVIMKNSENNTLIDLIIEILKSSSFQQELAAISGYDLSQTGKVLYEC